MSSDVVFFNSNDRIHVHFYVLLSRSSDRGVPLCLGACLWKCSEQSSQNLKMWSLVYTFIVPNKN